MPELLIILVILLLLFGASRLPSLARSIGQAKREFDEALEKGKEKPSTRTEGASQEKAEQKADSGQGTSE